MFVVVGAFANKCLSFSLICWWKFVSRYEGFLHVSTVFGLIISGIFCGQY